MIEFGNRSDFKLKVVKPNSENDDWFYLEIPKKRKEMTYQDYLEMHFQLWRFIAENHLDCKPQICFLPDEDVKPNVLSGIKVTGYHHVMSDCLFCDWAINVNNGQMTQGAKYHPSCHYCPIRNWADLSDSGEPHPCIFDTISPYCKWAELSIDSMKNPDIGGRLARAVANLAYLAREEDEFPKKTEEVPSENQKEEES